MFNENKTSNQKALPTRLVESSKLCRTLSHTADGVCYWKCGLYMEMPCQTVSLSLSLPLFRTLSLFLYLALVFFLRVLVFVLLIRLKTSAMMSQSLSLSLFVSLPLSHSHPLQLCLCVRKCFVVCQFIFYSVFCFAWLSIKFYGKRRAFRPSNYGQQKLIEQKIRNSI